MHRCTELHNQAMDLAEQAMVDPESPLNKSRYLKAARLESEAAANFNKEPTRGVLYRSAAWLSANAGDYKSAIMHAESGLEGTPPPEIAEELIEVRDYAKAQVEVSDG